MISGRFIHWLQIAVSLFTSGNDLLKAHTQAVHNLDEIIAGIGNYVEAKTPKLIKFLTLFCNAEGENLERWDEQIGLSKYEDWSHIPMSDFFCC